MANTRTPTGSVQASATLTHTLAGDEVGSPTMTLANTQAILAGAALPNIDGDTGFYGVATCTSTPTDIELAHATDPLQGLGDATQFQAQSPASKKLKALMMKNLSAAAYIDVTNHATLGLAGMGWAASQLIKRIMPNGCLLWTDPAGSTAMVNDTNDHVTLTAQTGTPTLAILAIYGP